METLPTDDLDPSISEYAKELRELITKSGELFEQQFVYISAGTLAATFFIVEKLFGEINKTPNKSLIIISWLFLGFSLIFNMLTHFITVNYHSATLDDINTNGNNYNVQKATIRNDNIKYLNLACLIMYFLGLLFFLLYMTVNLL